MTTARAVYDSAVELAERVLGTDGETTDAQLNRVGRRLFGRKYAGAYAADERPPLTGATPYAIMNAGRRAGGGTHWYAVARLPGGRAILASDSFGRPIRGFSEDYETLTQRGRYRVRNADRRPEQRRAENNCGARSIAWLWVYHTLGERAAAEI